jgi:integrase
MAVNTPRSCGIDHYVHWIPEKRRWRFRRRVPGDLVEVIGKPEWRSMLRGRTEAEAKREALPFLEETDRTIKLALAGNWPPVDDDEVQALAIGWWADFRETRAAELERRTGSPDAWVSNTDPVEWALANEKELECSVDRFLSGPRNLDYILPPELDLIVGLLDDPKRAAGLRRNVDAMAQLLHDCRLHHHAFAKTWADEWRERDRATDRVAEAMHVGALESRDIVRLLDRPEASNSSLVGNGARAADAPTVWRPAIRFDDEDGDDLIAQWARWPGKRGKLPGDKTVYEARRMMRKLIAFVGFDDLRRLTRKQIEDWIELLVQTAVRPGEKMAPMTVRQHLIQLKALGNFAIYKEMIEVNPAQKIVFSARPKTKIRGFTDVEARVVLEAARRETVDYKRWLPWLCCFTGSRLDEPAGAAVVDVEEVGRYWVLNVRLDHRHEGATIKNESSVRRVPLHPKLIEEGFLHYVRSLPRNGPLFPSLRPDKFGSKAGNSTKRIGPIVRGLAGIMPSLADKSLSPNHSWRHRLHNECRRLRIREDVENALIGHAQEGSGPGYGEYAINDVLGPAIDQTRSPFAGAD